MRKLRPPNEREHIHLIDPNGKEFNIYKGIPTIIPSGGYTLQDTITDGYYICGETKKDVVWSFKKQRWIIPTLEFQRTELVYRGL